MTSLDLCILVLCLAVCTTAQQTILVPLPEQATVADVSGYKIELSKDGYRYAYETSDNSYRLQEGTISNLGTDKEELVVVGTYTYRNGFYVTVVEYVADKNGYRPRVQVTYAPILSISGKILQSLSG